MRRIPRLAHLAGFTLIEMLTTLAIVGIVSTITVSNMVESISGYRLGRATTQMVWDLQALRVRAISYKQPITVKFIKDGVYTVWTDSNGNNQEDAGEVQTKDIGLSYKGIKIISTNSPTFNTTGTINNPASITITKNGNSKTINMNTSGLIKII